MLPPALSSEICSLRPGEDRKAVTVEMVVDTKGQVLNCRFYRSLIRSDARLDYEQVERMFRGDEVVDSRLAGPLQTGRILAQTLREARHQRGSLRIESVEPEFEWDDEGHVIAADPSEELESHWYIENFMVLANEQVASFLQKEKVPTVYRVHDLPDPFNLARLLDILSSLGLSTPVFDPNSAGPDEISRVTRQTAEWVDRQTPKGRGKAALVQQVLRAQAKAVYQTDNIGHFGLASRCYCHFTSPIRRYPDLLVHRGLLARLGVAAEPTTALLADWAEHCSQTERAAAKIELKADDVVLAHLLRRRLDEAGWEETGFEGQILSLTPRGMFVLFDRLFQGYLSTRELPRDYYDLNELETLLEGRRNGSAYKVADLVSVRVIAIDEARGRVDLGLVADLETDPGPRRSRQGNGSTLSRAPDRVQGQGRERQNTGRPTPRKAKTTRTRAPKVGRPNQGRGRR
jgi:ribonuclease R